MGKSKKRNFFAIDDLQAKMVRDSAKKNRRKVKQELERLIEEQIARETK